MTDDRTKCGTTTTSPAAQAPTENGSEAENMIDGIETEIEVVIGIGTAIEIETEGIGVEMVAGTETETETEVIGEESTEETATATETETETETEIETVVEIINLGAPHLLATQSRAGHVPTPDQETIAGETVIEQAREAELAPAHHQNQSLPPHRLQKIWIQLLWMARTILKSQWQQCWVSMVLVQQSRRR